ncbi:Ig-like domain-containing protein [Candidatus Uhrbacteria bacterium]|nr:Ig-like domain-containing protein [Candidatus Uhrbacteria bacterium]
MIATLIMPFSAIHAAGGGGGSDISPPPPPPPSIGGTAFFDKVWSAGLGGWVDETSDASNTTADDIPVPSNFLGTVPYFGSKSPFNKLYVKIGSYGVGGSLKYQYFAQGGMWKDLTVTSNPSNDFKTTVSNGLTEVGFNIPDDWVLQSLSAGAPLNQSYSAFWIRLAYVTSYSTGPKLSQAKAQLMNLKVKIEDYGGNPWTTAVAPDYSEQSTCQSNYVTAYNAGNGIHYFAMKPGVYYCDIYFVPEGHIPPAILSGSGENFVATEFHDLSASTYSVRPRLGVLVEDELGNKLDPSKISATYDGMVLTGIPKAPNEMYFPVSVQSGKNLTLSYDGYVTEDGTSPNGNTAVASVVTGTATKPTAIFYAGTTPCVGSIASSVGFCAGLVRNLRLFVTNAAMSPISDANVTLYADAGMTKVATDLSKKLPPIKNTAGTTGVDGKFRAAISVLGTGPDPDAPGGPDLWYKITATGYKDATGKFTLVAGKLNAPTVVLESLTAPTPPPVITPTPTSTPQTPIVEPTPPPQPADTTVSADKSLVAAGPLWVKANGTSTGKVVVVVRNGAGQAISGKTVTLASSLGAVSIEPTQASTNAYGTASFTVKSSTAGAATFTASVDGVTLMKKPTITFIAPTPVACGSPVVPVGSLVKLADDGNPATQEDTAVYFYGKDCKRHAFPNSRAFFTWYGDFSGVVIVTPETLAGMPLGLNVRYRPGIKMVKFTTVDKVYVVGLNGQLRWIKSEAVAIALYGSDWNKKIDDLSDAFFTNYAFGSDVDDAAEFQAAAETSNAATIDDNL